MRKLRLMYASGPCNALRVYQHFVKGEDDPSHFALIYTQQFLNACQHLNAFGRVVSCRYGTGAIHDNDFHVSYLPFRFQQSSALLYHLEKFWAGLRLVFIAVTMWPDAIIVTSDWEHLYVLTVLSWLKIPIIVDLHNTFWPPQIVPSRARKFLLKLNSYMMTHACQAILAISDDIQVQIEELTQKQHPPIYRFFPTYRQAQFRDISPARADYDKFHVLYVGRIEENKGVYLLLEIAKRFVQLGKSDIVFDLCGSGSQLKSLRAAAEAAGLSDTFHCHGYMNRDALRAMYSRSHIVVAPTTKDFNEGFNKVVLEAILAGRPVITSPTCPSLAYVREAALSVPANDVDAYSEAILQLHHDVDIYEVKRQSALALQHQFYDFSQSWQSTLEKVLKPLLKSIPSIQANPSQESL